jgi:hypothetical protein
MGNKSGCNYRCLYTVLPLILYCLSARSPLGVRSFYTICPLGVRSIAGLVTVW